MKVLGLILGLGLILSACGGKSGGSSTPPAADVVGTWLDEERAAAVAKYEKDGNLDEACPAFHKKDESGKTYWLSGYFKIESSGKVVDCNIHPLSDGKDDCRESGSVSGNALTRKDGKASGTVSVSGNKGTFVINAEGRQVKMVQEKISAEQFTTAVGIIRECFQKTLPQPPAPAKSK